MKVTVPSLDRADILNGNVLKFSLHTQVPASGTLSPGDGPTEASYVSKKDAVNEDDGYLLQFVRRDGSYTFMNIYDAADMCNTLITTVHAPDEF